jgi:prepilin-type processing-associated H-X9-DG protein
LVELLVVITIIALLISILLPSLKNAREQSKTVKCAAQLRGLGNGMNIYASENNDYFPGMNTTGVAVRELRFKGLLSPEVLQDPYLPVQPHDWLSPLARYTTVLPEKRADRFHFITDWLRCPSQGDVQSVLYPFSGAGVADWDDFQEYPFWTSLSYLMPAHFQYYGQNQEGMELGRMSGFPDRKVTATIGDPDWEVVTPDYVSRLGRIGNASQKVFVADGTRFMTESGTIDHDVSPFPTHFGSFTSTGAWWSGSTTYGVRPMTENWDGMIMNEGSEAEGKNLSISYRHGSGGGRRGGDGSVKQNRGTINALFFDGHAEQLTDFASRDINLWYPKGAVVQDANQGLTMRENGYVVR